MTRKQQRQQLVGRRFGKLLVARYTHSHPKQGPHYECRCDCREVVNVRGSSLIHSGTSSCGCIQKEWCATGNARSKTGKGHAMTSSRIYSCWEGMIQRCENPNHKAFHLYGGAGITVCDEWKVFENFYRDMGAPTEGYTLDRINGIKGYFKENCRWATRMQQSHNTRTNVNVTFRGKTKCISQWAREIGISDSTLSYRLKKGWSKKQTFSAKAGERCGNQYGSRLTAGEQNGAR